MRRWRNWLLACAGFGLLVSGSFVCQRVADRGRFVSAYSSYGSGPAGTRALFLLAQRLGARPARWSEDLSALPERAMLLALSDCESGMARPLSRYEQEELTRWVEQGGVLLVAGARHYLPKGLGVSFEPEPRCAARYEAAGAGAAEEQEPPDSDATTEAPDAGAAEAEAEASEPNPAQIDDVAWTSPAAHPLLGLDPLPMRRPGRLVLDKPEQAQVLLSMPDAPGMPESPVQREVGVVVQHGKGRVIALASASMLQNRALAAADGGLLFARLLHAYASDGPVLFDEYHLGVGERRSMMRYLRSAGAMPFLLQLLLAAWLLLWRAGARFGGLQRVEAVQPRATLSFVSALGNLFARAGDPAGALQLLQRQALARVARHHHLPLRSARALSDELAQRGLSDAAAAVRRLAEVDRGRGGLAAHSRELDRLVARACR